MEIIHRIFSEIAEFKKQIIILIIFLAFFAFFKIGLPIVTEMRANQTPVVSIEAENDKTYNTSSEIKPEDFTIRAVHEDGKKTDVDPSEIKLSRTDLSPVGEFTKVTVSLIEDESISCETEVKVKREKVVGFLVGYPDAEDVKAVLYSNGELAFEGEGDVMVFSDGDYPWLDYDEEDDYPLTSVSFEETVTPTNMDYWFSGCETLTYVSPIPSSVKSMVETFEDCQALKSAADWSACTNLLNINYVYSECAELTNTYAIPESVKIAKYAYSDCTSLETTPDMSNATNLLNTDSMFQNCERLNTVSMPPATKYIDSMFEDCINLKNMPQIPETVVSMDSAFKGNTSLIALTNIPASVTEMANCFSNCPYIEGNLTIDCNAKSFSSMFSDAATATTVNLTGGSKLLDAYANTSSSSNVTVNGKEPDPNIKSYSDVANLE